MKENKKVKPITVIYAVGVVFAALIFIFGVMVYSLGIDNAFSKKVANIFPYPAAVINGTYFISIRELQSNLEAVRKFYENQDFSDLGVNIDFNSDDGKKMLKIKERDLLTKMIENRIIEIMASKRGINIPDDLVNNEIENRKAKYGSGDNLENNLKNLYGWDADEFKKEIVKPDMYKRALALDMRQSDPAWSEAKTKIDKAKQRLDNNEDFAAVAKSMSDGDSAKNGGELGWFGYDQMLPEIASSAMTLSIGQRSDVIVSSLGYHIIQVEDKKSDNDNEEVKLRQIFVRAKNFSDWLLDEEKNDKIAVLIRGMHWNDNGAIDFSSSDMEEFEKNVQKDALFGALSTQSVNY